LYHLEECVSSGRGGYHLEHESIIWRGMYHLEGEGIIFSRRVSSGDVCIIWKGWVSSGAGEYHMDRGGCYLPKGVEYHLEKHGKENQVLIDIMS
jgi:hypothetical protein